MNETSCSPAAENSNSCNESISPESLEVRLPRAQRQNRQLLRSFSIFCSLSLLSSPAFFSCAAAQEVILLDRSIAFPRIEIQEEEADEEADEKKEDSDEQLADGPLKSAAENLSKLISLEWDGRILKPKLLEDRTEVQQTIYAIRSVAGGGGMSSSSSGDNSWWYQFQGNQLTGTFQNNWPRGGGDERLLFQMSEVVEPFRELLVERSPDDSLSIMLTGGSDPFILRVKQQSDGVFVVQEVDGTEVKSFREKSFGDFCRKHVEFSQTRLIPVLKEIGITPPSTPQDLDVQNAVISFLSPIEEARIAEFDQLISNFDSASFDEREAATTAFSDDFQNYRDIVSRAIDDEKYSAETRTRLLGILKDKSEPSEVRTQDVVSRLNLDEDTRYLVWLLEQRTEEADKKLIADQLQELTEYQHGSDVAAWRDALSIEVSPDLAPESIEIDERLLTSNGQLIVMREETAKLVKLALTDGELTLDREHWSKPFGGKTLSQLTEEINEELNKRGLPASFFNGIDEKRYPLVGYPHVIFESFYQELMKHPEKSGVYRNRSVGSHHNPNRVFSLNGLECSISTQPGGNGRVIGRADAESNMFRLRLSEATSPKRTLTFEADQEEHVRIEFTCEDADVIIRLMQLPEDGGWVLQDLRGTEVFAQQAASYAELYNENSTYFDETFFPLIDRMGFIPPNQETLTGIKEASEEDSPDDESHDHDHDDDHDH